MYFSENYFNDDLLNEDLLNEDLLGDFVEGLDEAKRPQGKRPYQPIRPGVRPNVTQQSNFGRNLSGNAADYATKSELKKALDSISNDVNELKKTSIATNKALAALDAKHTELAKIDLRKNENQTKVMRNMQMMSVIGSLFNQPKLKPENLVVVDKAGLPVADTTIKEKPDTKAIEVDQTMSLLLPMMTTMGDSGSGKSDNMNMMLPLVLIMNNQNKDKGNSNDNLLPIVLLMMMQNQK